jgi:hypothetical protein
MKISKREQEAIKTVVGHGREWGYGNMIGHLQSAWTKDLMDEYGLDEDNARRGSDAYPVKMHIDLMEYGEWDETGARYR